MCKRESIARIKPARNWVRISTDTKEQPGLQEPLDEAHNSFHYRILRNRFFFNTINVLFILFYWSTCLSHKHRQAKRNTSIMWCCCFVISRPRPTFFFYVHQSVKGKIHCWDFFKKKKHVAIEVCFLHSWIFQHTVIFCCQAWLLKQIMSLKRTQRMFVSVSQRDRADVAWLLYCWQLALLEQVDQEMKAGRASMHNWSDRAWKRSNK